MGFNSGFKELIYFVIKQFGCVAGASSNYTFNNPPRMQKPEAASAVLGS